MANLRDIEVTFEIEPIVKLICSAFECKHNLAMRYAQVGLFCNLKNVELGEKHECLNYESNEQKADNA